MIPVIINITIRYSGIVRVDKRLAIMVEEFKTLSSLVRQFVHTFDNIIGHRELIPAGVIQQMNCVEMIEVAAALSIAFRLKCNGTSCAGAIVLSWSSWT